uniref:Uncharacterized protein n=1 Tax=Eutreptiella gymnastica TaxID=73025 RepID=A0A7S1IF59_9EUGL
MCNIRAYVQTLANLCPSPTLVHAQFPLSNGPSWVGQRAARQPQYGQIPALLWVPTFRPACCPHHLLCDTVWWPSQPQLLDACIVCPPVLLRGTCWLEDRVAAKQFGWKHTAGDQHWTGPPHRCFALLQLSLCMPLSITDRFDVLRPISGNTSDNPGTIICNGYH